MDKSELIFVACTSVGTWGYLVAMERYQTQTGWCLVTRYLLFSGGGTEAELAPTPARF
jgi:hypothetical protein